MLGAEACETARTSAEIAADRARAVEFFGASVGAQFGFSVIGAGDVNGDGFDDFALSAPNENSDRGAVYIVFGRSAEAWASAQFDFNATQTPDAASWIRISGKATAVRLGYKGLAGGDFNGDGLGDILIASMEGTVHCVYGHAGAWNSFNIADIEDGVAQGFSIASNYTCSARYVGNAGDINGDGVEDLLVADLCAPYATYIVFGTPGATRSAFDLSSVDGTNGFSLSDGTASLGVAYTMGPVGDLNGDGLADLGIGSYVAEHAYVLFARNVSATGQQWAGSLDITSVNGTTGFTIEGVTDSTFSIGWTVVGAGDVNSDSYPDLFIGSAGSGNGGAWIIFGRSAPWPSRVNVSQLDGMNGFRFSSSLGEHWGYSGGSAGDLNGDGFDDLVIGGFDARNSSGTTTGVVALLFGRNGAWPAELGRSDVVGSAGFLIEGPSMGSRLGYSAHGAGDVNGDGLADFIVGAMSFNSETGYATLVFGTPDDHCAVCSNNTDACLVCDDGYFLNSTSVCINASIAFSSSSSTQQGVSVVVIINFLEDVTDPTKLQEEIASVLGIDAGLVSVVAISPTEVEVTIIGSEEIAQRLVDVINNGGAGSDGSGLGLLRKAIDAHIRKDTNGSSDDGVDAASHCRNHLFAAIATTVLCVSLSS